MLVFVVPLKSAKVSNSWEQVSKLFERCIRSICNQTSPNFKVVVICNEQPIVAFEHPSITYVEVDFPLPEQGTLSQLEYLNLKRTDKGRKMLKGLTVAQSMNPTHTMLVDADDCVSQRLAEFVEQHPNENGWYIAKGYRYQDGDQKIYLKRNNFYRMCGSCNILRNDLNFLPETPEYNRGYGYYKYYLDHQKVRNILAKQGTPLAPLPFAGAVYMTATGENIYFDQNRLYQGILSVFNYKPLTQAVQSQFSLYPVV